jgi:hypothetical protein
MIKNSKENLIHEVTASLRRTAVWRRQLQARYPTDARNVQAAAKLDQLADEMSDLSDDAWAELSPHYDWCSGRWSDAVSMASRHVFFHNVETLPAFIDDLVSILSQTSSVAA